MYHSNFFFSFIQFQFSCRTSLSELELNHFMARYNSLKAPLYFLKTFGGLPVCKESSSEDIT